MSRMDARKSVSGYFLKLVYANTLTCFLLTFSNVQVLTDGTDDVAGLGEDAGACAPPDASSKRQKFSQAV